VLRFPGWQALTKKVRKIIILNNFFNILVGPS
jgi:hypothetical protein